MIIALIAWVIQALCRADWLLLQTSNFKHPEVMDYTFGHQYEGERRKTTVEGVLEYNHAAFCSMEDQTLRLLREQFLPECEADTYSNDDHTVGLEH